MRRTTLLICTLALMLLGSVGVAVAPASAALPTNALSGFPEAGTAEPSTEESPTASATSSSESGSGSTIVIVGIAAVVLLGGISFLIVKDARKVAPEPESVGGGLSEAKAAQMRKRRAKAKAARRQRKRNR